MSSGVLYQRDQDADSDAWDDTLLIKAYDNAVSVMKAKLAAQHPEYSIPTSVLSKKKKKNKQKTKKKKSRVSKSNSTWKAGDLCQAVYTEDGEIYSAQILSVDNDNGTCYVQYVDYGNEEEQDLDSLLPALSEPSSSQDNKTDTASEVDSSYEAPRDRQPDRRRSNKGTYVGGQSSKSNAPPWSWNNFTVPHPPPPPAAHHYPGYPHPPAFPTGFGATPQFPPMFPTIPPPPPVFNTSDAGNENEALYSMLISWYMSGYHTGYYQGLKSGKSSLFGGPPR